uniref:Pentacotripeptide-repeat region of PRORP domain-containing protein n=1 Tax=Alexandrium catenella TaxID=2925 RepID=A0A7S1SFE5_ALECA
MVTMLGAAAKASAMEVLSLMSFEVAMFLCAAVVYLAFSGGTVSLRSPDKARAGRPASPKEGEKDGAVQAASRALRQGKVDEAVSQLLALPKDHFGTALAAIAPRLLTMLAKEGEPQRAVALLGKLAESIEPAMLEAAVVEAQRRKDVSACIQLDRIASQLSIEKSQRTFEVLAKAYSGDLASLRALMDAAGTPLTKGFAKAVLEASAMAKDVDLVVEVFERADPSDAAALRAFAEQAAANVAAAAVEEAPCGAALGPKNAIAHASEIRTLGRAGNLAGAISLFERLPAVSGRPGTLLVNTLIDACVECGDLAAANAYLAKAQQCGAADAVSFNTLMKGLLAAGKEAEAHQVLEELLKAGIQATQASYHGLIHARVLARDARAAWCLVDKMTAAGVRPNAVTCSILLKMLTLPSHAADVPRVMKLVEAVEDSVDEVLLTSMLEACLRTRQLEMVSRILEGNLQKGHGTPLSSPMYGSMIKSFGQARDVPRVWALWHDMAARKVQASAITLGCMMEALVSNGHAEDAWQLLRETWEDEGQRHLVNTVTYTTLIKGFAKQPDKVLAMYEEMKARGIQCNTITYNTLLNACAQCRAMHRVTQLLEDMRSASPPVEPDVVTYSTLIKGFCASGNLDRALGLLGEIEKDGKHAPDEMLYNSLLDGCAKEQRLDEALRLVDRMRQGGVAPSNYTLSMMVKLLGRCRRLAQAFSMVDSLAAEFGFRPNIQVYTCLIQACFHNRQPNKAVALLERILADGIRPDEKTYTVLASGLLHQGQVDKAAGIVLRSLKDEPPVGVESRCLEDLRARLNSGPAANKQMLAELEAARSRGASRPVDKRAAAGSAAWPRDKAAPNTGRDRAAPPPWRRAPSTAAGAGAAAAAA